MEKDLSSWKMPKVPTHKIYKKSWFSLFGDRSTKTVEETIPLSYQNLTYKLLANDAFSRLFERENGSNKFLHIGLVQVGVMPLTRQNSQNSIILCLRDARHLNFQASLLALVESSLSDGPIYFNCFANLMVSLSDYYIENSLAVNIKTNGDEVMSGVHPLVFSYRVYYRVVSTPFAEKALKESPAGQTVLFQSNVRSNATVSKSIKWEEIQIPTSWTEEQVEEPRNPALNLFKSAYPYR